MTQPEAQGILIKTECSLSWCILGNYHISDDVCQVSEHWESIFIIRLKHLFL